MNYYSHKHASHVSVSVSVSHDGGWNNRNTRSTETEASDVRITADSTVCTVVKCLLSIHPVKSGPIHPPVLLLSLASSFLPSLPPFLPPVLICPLYSALECSDAVDAAEDWNRLWMIANAAARKDNITSDTTEDRRASAASSQCKLLFFYPSIVSWAVFALNLCLPSSPGGDMSPLSACDVLTHTTPCNVLWGLHNHFNAAELNKCM